MYDDSRKNNVRVAEVCPVLNGLEQHSLHVKEHGVVIHEHGVVLIKVFHVFGHMSIISAYSLVKFFCNLLHENGGILEVWFSPRKFFVHPCLG